ncbi:DinB family protein [Nocardiopsis sediminis]|uniref:DinB family protein n=1 Tax=Nocardiopsis sediminis TaxID=1778267 RepID=A0ABV8FR28_9ACTN
MTNTTNAPHRVDPPFSADERTMLTSWLDWHRATVWEKCAGLAAEHAGAAPLASSPLTSIGGVVAHLRWVEHFWFEVRLLGLPDQGPYTPDDIDAEWRLGAHAPLGELLTEYGAQCARSREITARLELGSAARVSGSDPRPVTLRWVLVHMVEETARHNGHLDILRELADGTVGE